ncbi:hypothetical protein Goarm_023180 [Gossypium armourianum]|uniref:Uncharacterized protein n=3 Tax=Gossypium TaxID=3633 RepID=A0A7J9KEQ2_9ROSI|nr:hypothetical protein [Gossypium armourianum]
MPIKYKQFIIHGMILNLSLILFRKKCSQKMEFIQLNWITQSVGLTQLKQINLTVILEVAS